MKLFEELGGFRVIGHVVVIGLLSGMGCDQSERLVGPDRAEHSESSRQVLEEEAFLPNWAGISEARSGAEGSGPDFSGINYQVDQRDNLQDTDEE